MKCQRCDVELEGGRGAYSWQCEVTALGEDVALTFDSVEDSETLRKAIFEQLETMTPEQIEKDVYQHWEGLLCRSCRLELGEALASFFNRKEI